MTRHVRRVVTGEGPDGKSTIIFDDTPPNTIQPLEGMVFSDIWEVGRCSSSTDHVDMADRPIRLEPTVGGSIFKVVTFPPVGTYQESDWSEVYEQIGASSATHEGRAMHKTRTIDYVVVLRGEIVCVLEHGEVLLKEGDVLVQRGTNHAWENRSQNPCTIVGVMIDNSR